MDALGPHYVELSRNTKGRDFVVGDIHGCYALLDRALLKVKFNAAADRLFSVGDLTNRGPQSIRALEYLQKPWFYAVRGNHEEMFLDSLVRYVHAIQSDESKTESDNDETFRGWIPKEKLEDLVKLARAIRALPYALSFPTKAGLVGIVHAELPENMDWKAFTEELAHGDLDTIETATWGSWRWMHRIETPIEGLSRLFSGHMKSPGGLTKRGNQYYIDTGAYMRVLDKSKTMFGLTMVEATASNKILTAPNKRKLAVNVRLSR